MKKITIVTAALLAAMTWTGCQNTLEQEAPVVPGEKPEALRDSVTLTLEAVKGIDTKALALDTSGDKDQLKAYWMSGEEVKVFVSSGTCIGTLTATPTADNTKATLSGNIDATSLAAGQTLTLLFPQAIWSYNNQGGTLSSIASDFDFAKATVTIESFETNRIITTPSVTFENQQSIYRFGFHHNITGSPTIRTETVKITSDRGQLVKTVNAASGAATATFSDSDPLTVNLTPALTTEEAAAHALIYVAIRNDNTTQNDTFSFEIYDADHATYKGSQNIPAASLTKGFVSAKNVALSRLEVPQGSTNVATAL